MSSLRLIFAAATVLFAAEALAAPKYPWALKGPEGQTLVQRFKPPRGYKRVAVKPGSYGWFLRHLPLRPTGTAVQSHRGGVILAPGHRNLAGVVDLPLVRGNLQQCADSILRLRAEYLWSRKRFKRISFQYTSGYVSSWSHWSRGRRPKVVGRKVIPIRTGRVDSSRKNFVRYMRNLFIYAGTWSIRRESKRVKSLAEIRAGDFFVLSGSPGHAVVVLDLARNASGRLVALVGQGFMPAQDFHVLRPGPTRTWFALDPAGPGLKTPFWQTFPWSSLHRHR